MSILNARKVAPAFALGVVAGGLLVHVMQRKNDAKEIFARKQECQSVAIAYQKKYDLPDVQEVEATLIVNQDYSPARNSCAAIVLTEDPKSHTGTEAVVDLLTDETLFVRPYAGQQRLSEVDEAFQKSTHDR